jgi:hypothetical protein
MAVTPRNDLTVSGNGGTGEISMRLQLMQHRKSEVDIAKYLLSYCVIGGAAGIFWASLMLATNTAGLATLISHSSSPATDFATFLTGSAAVFQPLAVAAAIARLGPPGDG